MCDKTKLAGRKPRRMTTTKLVYTPGRSRCDVLTGDWMPATNIWQPKFEIQF